MISLSLSHTRFDALVFWWSLSFTFWCSCILMISHSLSHSLSLTFWCSVFWWSLSLPRSLSLSHFDALVFWWSPSLSLTLSHTFWCSCILLICLTLSHSRSLSHFDALLYFLWSLSHSLSLILSLSISLTHSLSHAFPQQALIMSPLAVCDQMFLSRCTNSEPGTRGQSETVDLVYLLTFPSLFSFHSRSFQWLPFILCNNTVW